MTSKRRILASSESSKARSFSEDNHSIAQNIPTLVEPDDHDGCHLTRQVRRRASLGDVMDIMQSPYVPRSRSYDSVVFDFRDVAADDFANQLTLIDLKLFRAIPRQELACGGWDSRERKTLTPNVYEFSRRFNNVSFWVVREVLSAESVKVRVSVLKHFVRIAKRLYELSSLHSMMAVVTALQSAPIHRLIQTWRQLPNKEKRTFDKLDALASVEDNRQALRLHIEESSLPCIPYLGLFTQDLTYLRAMAKRTGSSPKNGHGAFAEKMEMILDRIEYYQQSDYDTIECLPHIEKYLLSVKYIEEFQAFVDEDLFKLSLEREPHGSRQLPGSPALQQHIEMKGYSRQKSSTLPRPASAADGFVSPRPVRTRLDFRPAGSSSSDPADSQAKKPFKVGHRKSRSLGGIQAALSGGYHAVEEPPVEPMSCLYPLNDSPTSRTPITSGDDLSTDTSDVDTAHTWSTASIASCATDSGDELIDESGVSACSLVEHEGYVKRKVIRKMGRKPSTGTKILGVMKFWASISGGCFLLYSPKTRVKRKSREEFKNVEHYCVQLNDAIVALNTSRRNKPSFTLTDRHATVYKFRTRTEEEATEWAEQLQVSINSFKPTKNLINFDEEAANGHAATVT